MRTVGPLAALVALAALAGEVVPSAAETVTSVTGAASVIATVAASRRNGRGSSHARSVYAIPGYSQGTRPVTAA